MDIETINFIFAVAVGVCLIPIFFAGPFYFYERFWVNRRKTS